MRNFAGGRVSGPAHNVPAGKIKNNGRGLCKKQFATGNFL